MLNIWLLNRYEIVLLVFAVFLLILHYKRSGYNKEELIMWMLLLIPILYFSINMVTEVVTVDEPQYEECITDIRNLKDHGAAGKLLFQYKFAQLTVGTFFGFFLQRLKEYLGSNQLWMLYKSLHWFLMYVLSLITTMLWRKNILNIEGEKRARLAENMVLITMIGIPLTCMLMKVDNYDAGSTYPAILGISMIWSAFNKNENKLAFWGTVVTALGVLEKYTALPYWIISVILFALLNVRNKGTWKSRLVSVCMSTIIAYFAAIGLSALYFLYTGIQQDGFITKIDLGILIFSFVQAVKSIVTGDTSVNSSPYDIVYIPIILCVMIIGTLMIYFVCKQIEVHKKCAANIFLKIDGALLAFGLIGGVIGAYFIPLRIAPLLEIENGAYISHDSFDGWVYHYGAKSAIGHFMAKICYEWATIVANYPTFIFILLIVVSIFLMILRHEEKLLICAIILSGAIALLVLYAVAGLPQDARYYSYPMMVIALAGIYLAYVYMPEIKNEKLILYAGYALYVAEMLLYVPNVKSFSPMWLWHDHEHNTQVRTGQWYAGEIMFWGEHNAIAGNIIENMADDESGEVVIYSDYATIWPGNPGYTILPFQSQEKSNLRFDEKAYYIFNKFVLFRGEAPKYIYEEEPIATVHYKGEIGAWIYRGDQLKEYFD